MEEHYRMLADTAVLAGEIMLKAGAETCRVEDTIRRILSTSGFDHCEAFVVTTGIMVTLESPGSQVISLNRRVRGKSTNLGNIDLVNTISRQFCRGDLGLPETYRRLKNLEPVQYPHWLTHLCMVGTAACFTWILGGKGPECAVAAVNGLYFIGSRILNRKLHLNDFVFNMFASFLMAFTCLASQELFAPDLLAEPTIAGSIMALLPGLAMTNGIRDTLEGDYMSGTARMIEAFVTAASLALGIGIGMACCQLLFSLGKGVMA